MRSLGLLPLFLLMSCASWTASDSRWAADTANTAQTALDLCAPDASTCEASQVRALEQSQLCAASAGLARHKLPLPRDGGVAAGCLP